MNTFEKLEMWKFRGVLFFFLHHLLLFIFTSKSPQNDISVWLENLPKTTFLHESIFCFQIPKSPQNDIFRSNFTRLDSLLFFFLHHLLLFIFTSKSPQNDIFARKHFLFSNPEIPPKRHFSIQFRLQVRSKLTVVALRCAQMLFL